jgi:hypothetical protein
MSRRRQLTSRLPVAFIDLMSVMVQYVRKQGDKTNDELDFPALFPHHHVRPAPDFGLF